MQATWLVTKPVCLGPAVVQCGDGMLLVVRMTTNPEATEEAEMQDTCDRNMCNSNMDILIQDAYNRHIMQETKR